MKLIFLLVVSIFSSNVFAVKYKRNPIAHDPQKDDFFSGTDNKLAEKEQGPQKAIVKVGECLKYLKEGEIWEIDNTKEHSVTNNSNIDRIHLLIDYKIYDKKIKTLHVVNHPNHFYVRVTHYNTLSVWKDWLNV